MSIETQAFDEGHKLGVIEGLNLALNVLANKKSGCDINCMSEIEELITHHQDKK